MTSHPQTLNPKPSTWILDLTPTNPITLRHQPFLRNPLSSSIYRCTCTTPDMCQFWPLLGKKVLNRFRRNNPEAPTTKLSASAPPSVDRSSPEPRQILHPRTADFRFRDSASCSRHRNSRWSEALLLCAHPHHPNPPGALLEPLLLQADRDRGPGEYMVEG